MQNSSERRRTQIVIRITTHRPVKGVDQVAAELRERGFGERKTFEQAEVLRGVSGAAKITKESRRIPQTQSDTVGCSRWGSESRWIEVCLSSPARVIERTARSNPERRSG